MPAVKHLYIHLPFCARRCSYCDFYSREGGLSQARTYVEALLAELAGMQAQLGELETVYFGGGTPTLIGFELLAPLLDAVTRRCREGAEITMEANPGTVEAELAHNLRHAGVTRISLGAQSFVPLLRERLGRAGEAAAIARACAALRRAGFDNLSIDLIFGIPGQSRERLAYDLGQVLNLEPEHISYYELTTKAGSPWQRQWSVELKEQERWGAEFYRQVVDSLRQAGYRWYETSNFALPGRECRHNLAYWQAEDYIGLGASAWSTVGRRRWRNRSNIEGYIAVAATGDWQRLRELEALSRRQKLEEALMLGLRCEEGLPRAPVDRVIDIKQEELLRRGGFLGGQPRQLVLTDAGRFVANEVCARLLRG